MEKQNWKNSSIVVLSIALLLSIIAIIILIQKKSVATITGSNLEITAVPVTIPKIGPVDEDDCRRNVQIFRRVGTSSEIKKGFGLWYTIDDLNYYLTQVYPAIKNAQESYMKAHGVDVAAYDWQIGCYWLENLDPRDRIRKNDFCFVPVIVDTVNHEAVDFFSSNLYGRNLSITIPSRFTKRDTTINTSLFNTGTMFP